MIAATNRRLNETADLRVLLVEDHRDTLNLLRMLLTRAGYVVVTAMCVVEAVQRISEEDFAILISDIGLPDGTGYDVARAYTGRPHGLAVALSGFGSADDVRRGQEAGFAHHLIKPRGVAQLLPLLKGLV
jgi:CheY-like chemotaxis protein